MRLFGIWVALCVDQWGADIATLRCAAMGARGGGEVNALAAASAEIIDRHVVHQSVFKV